MKTAKCPESLCPVSALPLLEDVSSIPARTLLPAHRSYGLIRQSHLPLLAFGSWPRTRSLRRLLPAPAATGIFPTLSLRIFPRMLGPMPRRSHRVRLPVSSPMSSAFPNRGMGRLPALPANTIFPRSIFRRCRHFLMFRPPSLLISQIAPTAAHTASGQLRLLRPGIACFVTSARTGYASRPNTGN